MVAKSGSRTRGERLAGQAEGDEGLGVGDAPFDVVEGGAGEEGQGDDAAGVRSARVWESCSVLLIRTEDQRLTFQRGWFLLPWSVRSNSNYFGAPRVRRWKLGWLQ